MEYRKIEKILQDRIFDKYLGSLSEKEERLWRELDDTLLYYEFDYFMKEKLYDCPGILKSRPLFRTEPFEVTEEKYMEWFRRLCRE